MFNMLAYICALCRFNCQLMIPWAPLSGPQKVSVQVVLKYNKFSLRIVYMLPYLYYLLTLPRAAVGWISRFLAQFLFHTC